MNTKFKVGDIVKKSNGESFFDGSYIKKVEKIELNTDIEGGRYIYRLEGSKIMWWEDELILTDKEEKFNYSNAETICRETDSYIRCGIKSELILKFNGKSKFSKRKFLPVTRVARLYNHSGDLIGTDVILDKEEELDVIHNSTSGITIVILYFEGKKFKGIAKCHEDDVYVPQIGYQIAKARATKAKCDHIISELTGGSDE